MKNLEGGEENIGNNIRIQKNFDRPRNGVQTNGIVAEY